MLIKFGNYYKEEKKQESKTLVFPLSKQMKFSSFASPLFVKICNKSKFSR